LKVRFLHGPSKVPQNPRVVLASSSGTPPKTCPRIGVRCDGARGAVDSVSAAERTRVQDYL
jgi:hypothetical protein